MSAKFTDKILFVLALLLVAGAGAWMFSQQKQTAPAFKTAAAPSPTDYKPLNVSAPDVPTESWVEPVSQPAGPLWIYEVFTSPMIYYDKLNNEFIPVPPVPPPPPVIPPFGVELVQTKADTYPLQLVGFVGPDGIFMNMLNGDTFLAHAGQAVPDLDLVIRDFQVSAQPMADLPEDTMPLIDQVATAVVVETKTGQTVNLSSQKRLVSGLPFAVLKVTNGAQLDPMKAGASFTVTLPEGDAGFKIDNITETPAPIAVVTKTAAVLKVPQTETLTIAPPKSQQSKNNR